MKLSKHKAHRNPKYLAWLREQSCIISQKKAECAHHVRLNTNGGVGIKPSDYFCIPLTNEFHTTGSKALHMMGEESFIQEFKLDVQKLFIKYLKNFLQETHEILYGSQVENNEDIILDLITLIESQKPQLAKVQKPKRSITDDPYYQKCKELKKQRDKTIRDKNKFSDDGFYQMAKEINRARQKELRDKNKAARSKYNKELRQKIKEQNKK